MDAGAKIRFEQHGAGVIQSRREINRILYMLSNIRGKNGIIVSKDLNGGLVIEAATNANEFSGTAYIAGVKTTGLNTYSEKPWVKCDITTCVASEEDGPPSNPFPPNEEWFEKDYTSGDIHVDRV